MVIFHLICQESPRPSPPSVSPVVSGSVDEIPPLKVFFQSFLLGMVGSLLVSLLPCRHFPRKSQARLALVPDWGRVCLAGGGLLGWEAGGRKLPCGCPVGSGGAPAPGCDIQPPS